MSRPKFYDWQRTLSYNSRFIMVVGARGIGKTFGIRKHCIIRFIKSGARWVEIVRHKNELDGDDSIINGYFDKVQELNMFPDWDFLTKGHFGYMRPAGSNDDWMLCAYFVAVTDEQKMKKRTFADVETLIYDEAILTKDNPYQRYVPNEWEKIANIVSTITRERPDVKSKFNAKVVFLANALDMVNPHFRAIGIKHEPPQGYSWHYGKRFLLHYVDNTEEYAQAAKNETLAGWMLSATDSAVAAFDNAFVDVSGDFIDVKPSTAEYRGAITYDGVTMAFWYDLKSNCYYVNSKCVDSMYYPNFVCSTKDFGVEYAWLDRGMPFLQGMLRAYTNKAIRFETYHLQETFLTVLRLFGIR